MEAKRCLERWRQGVQGTRRTRVQNNGFTAFEGGHFVAVEIFMLYRERERD